MTAVAHWQRSARCHQSAAAMWGSRVSAAPLPMNRLFPKPITELTALTLKHHTYWEQIRDIIDHLGVLSAISQGLKNPITSFDKLLETNHKIYLAVDTEENGGNGAIIGFLKLGEKKLFVTDGSEPACPTNIQCVLDFYINTEYQRHGWGKHLFEHAINIENIRPENMAYDRPSKKLINFLAKHYNLKNAIEQPNRYVIYKDFFNNMYVKYSQGRCLSKSEIRPNSAGYLVRRY